MLMCSRLLSIPIINPHSLYVIPAGGSNNHITLSVFKEFGSNKYILNP